ncbi:MAG: 3-deoxy-D-manno-octulosonic acid transferase [Alphaproteobacteria bacterium]
MAADTASRATFAAYRLFGHALRLAVPLILSRRAARGKEDSSRAAERYGRASLPRPSGRLVWVHAASVGETNAALPMIARLCAAGLFVVLTSTTVTSAAIAARRLPVGAVHQFAPLDIGPFVTRFLDHWRPELVLFMESELWPTAFRSIAAADLPLVVVNARLSDRTFRRWRAVPSLALHLFKHMRMCLAQSVVDGERYAHLGAPLVTVTGNLKFDVPMLEADPVDLSDVQAMVAGRQVWVAASTHPGEEEIIAEVHRRLAERRSDVLTIIVPRHPERGGAIRQLLDKGGFAVAQRSMAQKVNASTDIYLADTLGELGLFYRVAAAAFLGGSMITHGGQNPIEPARLAVPVLHGPHVHNFAEIYESLDEALDLKVVTDADGLAAAVGRLIDDPAAAKRIGEAGSAVIERHAGALDATFQALERFLGRLDDHERA